MKMPTKLMTVTLFLLLFAAPAFAGGGPEKQPKPPERLARKLVVAVVRTDSTVEALLVYALLQSERFYLWDGAALPSVPNRRGRGRAAAANVVNIYLSAILVSAEEKSRSGVAVTPAIPVPISGSGQRTATEAVIVLRAMLPSGQIIAAVVGEGNAKGSVLNSQFTFVSVVRNRQGSFGKALEIGAMDATKKLIATLNKLQAQQSPQ